MRVSLTSLSTALTLTLISSAFFMMSCGGEDVDPTDPTGDTTPNWSKENSVVVHEMSDPDKLNPITNSDASSTAILNNIYQKLMNVDFETNKLVPVLADSFPVVEDMGNETLHITYTIRDEAKWDDGTPVTGVDVAFTMKCIKNPKVDAQNKRGYLEFIRDVKLYDDNPKKLTYVVDKYVRAVYSTSAEIYIVPEHIYDPQHFMADFTIPQLNADASLVNNPKIIAFAEELNSEKWMREKGYIIGSGAYSFEGWETSQRISLKKKADWWGNSLRGTNGYFDVNIDEITYQIVNDPAGAISSLKRGDLEVMKISKASDYDDLLTSEAFQANFNAYASPSLIYTYVGINTTRPYLADKRIRRALAHLLDVQMIIDEVQNGYAERTIGPVLPLKDYYNKDIVPYDYNIEKASELLTAAGVVDNDKDGNLEFDGKPFKIQFSYNTGNESRKQVALIFKEACKQVGIDVEIISLEWSIYINNLKAHNFDIYYGAWVMEHAPQDPTQLWHRESANGGSNYPGFGNATSDSLIDAIKSNLDENTRRDTWMEFQALLHDEVPYIFISARKNLLAIHKRFDNAAPSSLDPGYWEAGFKVKGAATEPAQ